MCVQLNFSVWLSHTAQLIQHPSKGCRDGWHLSDVVNIYNKLTLSKGDYSVGGSHLVS